MSADDPHDPEVDPAGPDAPEDAAAEPANVDAPEAVELAAPKKRRKKKRTKRAPEAESELGGPKPSIARDANADAAIALPGLGTPDGAKLREAHVAFEAGNYARVRTLTRALAQASDSEVRAAAAALAARIGVDPLQIVVILACAAVVLGIVYRWII